MQLVIRTTFSEHQIPRKGLRGWLDGCLLVICGNSMDLYSFKLVCCRLFPRSSIKLVPSINARHTNIQTILLCLLHCTRVEEDKVSIMHFASLPYAVSSFCCTFSAQCFCLLPSILIVLPFTAFFPSVLIPTGSSTYINSPKAAISGPAFSLTAISK